MLRLIAALTLALYTAPGMGANPAQAEAAALEASRFTAAEEARIRDDYHKRLGAGVEVVLTRMAEIPPEKSGKYRYVVSHVPATTGGTGHA